ncbi:MAG: prolyl-tRNA synthetase [Candidatus Harrisonbacteria bacterium CG10_big_fil_rev_8_21_14_0_10_45_28]|uniref:Proline--tRNA ligase n=1 Tax=Candidatus Harrisonbacteria bacterium CG10_big_fil_rev_8_21_14_0_10_45_28 TaxID=1974586 RepID=A0A2H0UP28_9BACT|nr:MAG: prolyl-tRNA synthetase [Candidatus Harrisonbacteria bacterium CG10_big_fil_rev_8_21_14_0_10_45_28]
MAGVYAYLPLGLRVLNKIVGVIREEMNAIDGKELFLTALQEKGVWEKSGRWDDKVIDVWFKTALKNGGELGLATTHEEPLTSLMKNHINSYKDLPRYVYQFQTKFRNELRAKSGLLRGREFLMKDLYSFSLDQESHDEYYERAKLAYVRIFDRLGIGDKTFVTFASGGSFSKFSHEFQTLCDAGEDLIHVCYKCKVAVNKEILAEQNTCPECGSKELKEEKAIEVGNIFPLGTKFSDALDLTYVNEKNEKKSVVMGCYGIGPGRVMGTIVEAMADSKGLVWPENISPFAVHLISIGDVKERADELYQKMTDEGVEVLYDDRDVSAGEKLADSDLIGITKRMVISEKSLAAGGVEVKMRSEGEARIEKI